MVFKCKMCGGTLEFGQGDTVAVCDSCGVRQTIPRLSDERRRNLYDRAIISGGTVNLTRRCGFMSRF